jgi:NADPH:quinone reductase-like Zn-dependent oxidoreductase
MTAKMRTVRQDTLGGTDVLTLTETDRPTPGATEILVEVRAAGVNPIDWKIRQFGYWLTPPFVLGWDVSGVVAAVGPGETRFTVGDEVFGLPSFPAVGGGYAEYVVAPSRHFALKPTTVDHVAAAALPLSGSTAWQALVDVAELREGQRVLIHAAAGGVGHLAVQIAKARGAHVIGTATAAKHELLRTLGADEVVDYTAHDFAEVVRDVDVVLDLVGEDYEDRSLRTLRQGGLYIGITNPLAAESIAEKATAAGVRGVTVNVAPDHAVLAQLAQLVDDGKLRPVVAETFPLAEVAKAHDLGEGNHTTGKIVLTV